MLVITEKKYFLILCLFSLVQSNSAISAASRTTQLATQLTSHLTTNNESPIEIVTEEIFPFSYINEINNEIEGYCTNVVKAVMQEANLDYNITIYPWKRAFSQALNQKSTMIYSLGRTAEREDEFNWIGELIAVNYKLYGLNNNKDSFSTNLEDLKSQSIAVILNDLTSDLLKKKGFTNLVQTTNFAQSIKLLKRGRVQYLISSNLGIVNNINNGVFTENELVSIGDFKDLKASLYLAINRQSDLKLVQHLKDSFQNIVKNGTHSKIMSPLIEHQPSVNNLSLVTPPKP
ncbi:MAG: polar amino acid transport system substrate-binding protein [Enterobacterales bacterium]|jgi:polar amino acid transport system substrate-binding protein